VLRYLFISFILLTNVAGYSQKVFTLKQVVDTALQNNLALKQSELQMESAGIDWRQSKANLLPNLNGFANHGINQGRSIDPFTNGYIDQKVNFAGYGLSSGITLFGGLSLQQNIKQNSLAYEASKMDVQQQKDNLTLNTILAYLQVLSNEDLLAQSKSQVEVSRQQVERLEKMNKEGAIAPSLLSNLQGELAGNELAVVNSQNQLETSRLNLFQLMNVPYDENVKFERIAIDAFSVEYDATAKQIYETALENLALVKAANLRKQSAQKGVQVEKGLLYPNLSVNGNLNTNYSSVATQNIFVNNSEVQTDNYVLVNGVKTPVISPQPNFKTDKIGYNKQLSNNLYTTVSLDLRIPLFNNFSQRNRIKKASLVQKNYDYVAESTKIQLRQSIEQAYANMVAARNRYNALTKQVEAFALSFRISEVRFNAGVETAVDYVIAKNNYDRANSNLIIARYDYLLRTKVLDYYRSKPLW
jgi:outer membrane protein